MIFFLLTLLAFNPSAKADTLFLNANASPDEAHAFNQVIKGQKKKNKDLEAFTVPTTEAQRRDMYPFSQIGGKINELGEDTDMGPLIKGLFSNQAYLPTALKNQTEAVASAAAERGLAIKAHGEPSDAIAALYGSFRALVAAKDAPELDPALRQKINVFLEKHKSFEADHKKFVIEEKAFRALHQPTLLEQLDAQLAKAKAEGRTLDTFVLSGHSAGQQVLSNILQSIDKCDWETLSSKYPEQFEGAQSVILMGCLMGTSASRDFWHKIFPNAVFVAGYNSKAPPEGLESKAFMKQTMDAGEKIIVELEGKGDIEKLKGTARKALDLIAQLDGARRPVMVVCQELEVLPKKQEYSGCDLKREFAGFADGVENFKDFQKEIKNFQAEYFPANSDSKSEGKVVDPNILYKQVRALDSPACLTEIANSGLAPAGQEKLTLDRLANKAFALRNWGNFRLGYKSFLREQLDKFRTLYQDPRCEGIAKFDDVLDLPADFRTFQLRLHEMQRSPEFQACAKAVLPKEELKPGEERAVSAAEGNLSMGSMALGYISHLAGATTDHMAWFGGANLDQTPAKLMAALKIPEREFWMNFNRAAMERENTSPNDAACRVK